MSSSGKVFRAADEAKWLSRKRQFLGEELYKLAHAVLQNDEFIDLSKAISLILPEDIDNLRMAPHPFRFFITFT